MQPPEDFGGCVRVAGNCFLRRRRERGVSILLVIIMLLSYWKSARDPYDAAASG
jgi:hypothetical protein